MLEAEFQSKVMKFLKKKLKDKQAFFWKASDKFISGIPDIMGCYNGHTWGIELKVGKNTPTKLQELTIEKLNLAGAMVSVCYSLKEVETFIEEVIKKWK
jgi:hypothetical protein